MAILKRERWHEKELSALPAGEHDYFDRKSGASVNDKHFEESLAKALSAFANTGGGHLILGVKNDGTIDGVPATRGKTLTREWLEQYAPNLLSYPLQDIRVHEVERDELSDIPEGMVVIVIDVGDSILAPHQTTKEKIYYYRVGSHSKPAPHFYLETLRGRQNFPGKKVARAWLDTVIRPLLGNLKREWDFLSAGKWTWSHIRGADLRGEYNKQINLMNQSQYYVSENQEQFVEYYRSLNELLDRHDREVETVNAAINDLLMAARDSDALRRAYEASTEPQALEKVRKEEGTFSHDGTGQGTLRALLGGMNRDETFELLAKMIVAQVTRTGGMTIGPLWTVHREQFLAVLRDPHVDLMSRRAAAAGQRLLGTVDALTAELKETRRQLAMKHAEPFEMPSAGSRR